MWPRSSGRAARSAVRRPASVDNKRRSVVKDLAFILLGAVVGSSGAAWNIAGGGILAAIVAVLGAVVFLVGLAMNHKRHLPR